MGGGAFTTVCTCRFPGGCGCLLIGKVLTFQGWVKIIRAIWQNDAHCAVRGKGKPMCPSDASCWKGKNSKEITDRSES